MREYVTVKLTRREAVELAMVAGNGSGDGEFWTNPDGTDTGHGGRRAFQAYLRANGKIWGAIVAYDERKRQRSRRPRRIAPGATRRIV